MRWGTYFHSTSSASLAPGSGFPVVKSWGGFSAFARVMSLPCLSMGTGISIRHIGYMELDSPGSMSRFGEVDEIDRKCEVAGRQT